MNFWPACDRLHTRVTTYDEHDVSTTSTTTGDVARGGRDGLTRLEAR